MHVDDAVATKLMMKWPEKVRNFIRNAALPNTHKEILTGRKFVKRSHVPFVLNCMLDDPKSMPCLHTYCKKYLMEALTK